MRSDPFDVLDAVVNEENLSAASELPQDGLPDDPSVEPGQNRSTDGSSGRPS